MTAFRTGLVLGKFLPPHAGHLYLVRMARRLTDRLAVVVEPVVDESIPIETRVEWMRELLPHCEVLRLPEPMPQAPEEHPQFWSVWTNALRSVLPFFPEAVFASETYGFPLASALSARFVPIDPLRQVFPVSGTQVRTNPAACWDHLPAPVRAHYLRRVAIVGPESTGKTTLARQLAQAYRTLWVPEYAETVIRLGATQSGDTRLRPEDLEIFAHGQRASEEEIARSARVVLFCDSTALTTALWSNHLFGQCPAWLSAEAHADRYALTLLSDVDIAWEEDEHRYAPQERRAFFERFVERLEAIGRPYAVVSGQGPGRAKRAVEHIRHHLGLDPALDP